MAIAPIQRVPQAVMPAAVCIARRHVYVQQMARALCFDSTDFLLEGKALDAAPPPPLVTGEVEFESAGCEVQLWGCRIAPDLAPYSRECASVRTFLLLD